MLAKKQQYMFLVCVYDCIDGTLYKRRIANSIDDINDWVNRCAPYWTARDYIIDRDDYGNGYIVSAMGKLLFSFETHAIAVL